jgi:glyoxylase-like metal-dependent hydrolase (beta-lactamase superfamily II)
MLRSLERLAGLDRDLLVYPGHGPSTTIGAEIAHNPWLIELA